MLHKQEVVFSLEKCIAIYVAKNILKELEGVFSLENLKCTAI